MKNTSNKAFLKVAILSTALFSAIASAKEFRLGLITPPPHVWTKSANTFADELKTVTKGKLSVTVFPSRQLGNEAQMMQQLQTGGLDMAFLTMAEISNRVPQFGAFYAPYLVKDIQGAGQLLRSDTAQKMLKLLPRKAGVIGIGYGMGGLRQIASREVIDSAADLKGKKLRITPFEPIKDFYTALGAAATPMPLSAVYDAMANGQVDAIDMDLELIWKLKYYEHSKDVVVSNHMMFPVIGLVSAKVWKGLSKEERATIAKIMAKNIDNTISQYIALEPKFLAEVQKTGANVKMFDAGLLQNATDQWNATWSKKSKGALGELRATVQANSAASGS